MTKPILHFVHANSYPAGTYRVFLDGLRAHYEVQALEMHAHNPRYPVRNGWRELALELIDELVARYDEPVTLVGHSMGGMLSLMAAQQRPALVRCAVLLDSPVVGGWKAQVVRIAKHLGFAQRFSPGQFSARRRNLWPDPDTAYRHFASKEMFAVWPPEVLHDYIKSGMMPHEDGVALRFTREIETAVYRTLPHDLAKFPPGFRVPIGFIGGTDSVECKRAGLAATRKLVGRNFRLIPGDHLFPLESPALAARVTHEMIQALLSS